MNKHARTLAHTHTHTHSLCVSLCLSLSHSLLCLCLSCEHAHAHTHTHILSFSACVCVSLPLSHSLSLSLSLSLYLSLSLSLSHTHTHGFAHIVFFTPQTQRASKPFLLEPLVLCWKHMQTRGKKGLDCSFLFYVFSNIAHQWHLIGVRTTSVSFYMFLSL